LIVATAGHVDHGKTSLVKRLTGVDTDRTAEEKRRGLSINLGFAYRRTESGEVIGFIDVPGHRRFINTMIAGIGGIDLALVVVAADDGVMPQTREHVNALRLLGVERFLLVVGKIDLAGEDAREWATRASLALLPEGTDCIAVSSRTGEGVAELWRHLQDLTGSRDRLAPPGYFRRDTSACRLIGPFASRGRVSSSPAPRCPGRCARETNCDCCRGTRRRGCAAFTPRTARSPGPAAGSASG